MSVWDTFKKMFGIGEVKIADLDKAAVANSPPPSRSSNKNADIEVTAEYKEILTWLHNEAPIVFVTGKAGTGKSTLIRYICEQYEGNVAVVAPTGIAALQIGGSTIHSLFHFPARFVLPGDIKRSSDRQLFKKLKLLIIDEISMVRVELIDAIDKFLRLHRSGDLPFGGVQLLLVGDLFQLPPVVDSRTRTALTHAGYKSPYFFSAKALADCGMAAKELSKVYRQKDATFIELLNHVRTATSTPAILPLLNARHAEPPAGLAMITLSCKNNDADAINARELMKINAKSRIYTGTATGKFNPNDEKLPSPINLELKVGAQVMFTKNGAKGQWVNGTLGVVRSLTDERITVKESDGDNGRIYEVYKERWELYKYAYDSIAQKIVPIIEGTYTQFPLMLAWAVTIHKSQGKTLDRVRIDLGSGAFDYGQVYVALSRCRSLNNIWLSRPIRDTDIKCDPMIVRFYRALDIHAQMVTTSAEVRNG